MKFAIFLLSILTLTGCTQKTEPFTTPSSWIGNVTMGEATPEVVFNIFKDSVGNVTGDLDVPSKGIQGIPLSRVEMKQDSIIIESAAAQLIYKGVFKENKKRMVGEWREPQLTSPLILLPLTTPINYANYKKENTSSLDLQLESTHFKFYSKAADTSALKKLSNTLERNYSRITENMNTRFESKIDVFIYPDVVSFHTAINAPDAPDWVVGAASKNELKMVSPLNPGSEHTYESLMEAIVHEFAHTVVLNFRDQGLVGLPKWLNEGYAYYEAGQLTKAQYTMVYDLIHNQKIPSWSELETADDYQFGDLNGYPISATIIEFLVSTYGMEKLKQSIMAPEKMGKIYKVSKEDLERLWVQYITEN